jgi:Na+-transporting NADH:ubiquinone oxidoreductase subunit F
MREAFYLEDFAEIEKEYPNFSFHLALSDALPEDNWTGPKGFIHQVLYDNYLKDHKFPEDVEYYLCGPPMMTSSAVAMLDSLGVPPENILYDNF